MIETLEAKIRENFWKSNRPRGGGGRAIFGPGMRRRGICPARSEMPRPILHHFPGFFARCLSPRRFGRRRSVKFRSGLSLTSILVGGFFPASLAVLPIGQGQSASAHTHTHRHKRLRSIEIVLLKQGLIFTLYLHLRVDASSASDDKSWVLLKLDCKQSVTIYTI